MGGVGGWGAPSWGMAAVNVHTGNEAIVKTQQATGKKAVLCWHLQKALWRQCGNQERQVMKRQIHKYGQTMQKNNTSRHERVNWGTEHVRTTDNQLW